MLANSRQRPNENKKEGNVEVALMAGRVHSTTSSPLNEKNLRGDVTGPAERIRGTGLIRKSEMSGDLRRAADFYGPFADIRRNPRSRFKRFFIDNSGDSRFISPPFLRSPLPIGQWLFRIRSEFFFKIFYGYMHPWAFLDRVWDVNIYYDINFVR